MIPRYASAFLGLLAFSVTVFAGLAAHNSFRSVLSKALWAMFVFFLIGLVVGGAAQLVVREHVRRREEEPDVSGPSDATDENDAGVENNSIARDASPMGT